MTQHWQKERSINGAIKDLCTTDSHHRLSFLHWHSNWTETPLNFSASLFEAIFCPFLPNWGARMRFELNLVLCSGKVEQATVFALKQVCVRPFNSCLLPKGQATEKSNENIPFLLGCISMQIHKIYLFVCRGGKPKYQRIPKLPPFVKARKPQWQNKPTGSWMTATAEKNVKNVQNYCWDSRQRERERKKRQICDNFFVVLHLHGFCPSLDSFFCSPLYSLSFWQQRDSSSPQYEFCKQTKSEDIYISL